MKVKVSMAKILYLKSRGSTTIQGCKLTTICCTNIFCLIQYRYITNLKYLKPKFRKLSKKFYRLIHDEFKSETYNDFIYGTPTSPRVQRSITTSSDNNSISEAWTIVHSTIEKAREIQILPKERRQEQCLKKKKERKKGKEASVVYQLFFSKEDHDGATY